MWPPLLACTVRPDAAGPDTKPEDSADTGMETTDTTPDSPPDSATSTETATDTETDTGPQPLEAELEPLVSTTWWGLMYSDLGYDVAMAGRTSAEDDAVTLAASATFCYDCSGIYTLGYAGPGDYYVRDGEGGLWVDGYLRDEEYAMVPDSDGDGAGEILVAPNGGVFAGRAVVAAAYELPLDGIELYEAADTRVLGDDMSGYAGSVLHGDLDGDGLDELGVTSPKIRQPDDGEDPSGGNAFFSRAATTADREIDDADYLLGTWESGSYGAKTLIPGDLTGDGHADLVLTDPGWETECYDASYPCGRVGILAGPLPEFARPDDLVVFSVIGENDAGWLGAGYLPMVADIDGDGTPDLGHYAYMYNETAWKDGWFFHTGPFNGTVTPSDAHASVEIDQSEDRDERWTSAAIVRLGDVDGDGASEAMWANWSDDGRVSDAGGFYLLWGPLSGRRSSFDTYVRGTIADRKIGTSFGTADVDADGTEDLLLGAGYDDSLIDGGGSLSVILGKDLASLRP